MLSSDHHIVLNIGQREGKRRQLYKKSDIPISFYKSIFLYHSRKGKKGVYFKTKFKVNINQRKITFPAPFVNATTDDTIQSFVVMSFCVAIGSSCSIVAF